MDEQSLDGRLQLRKTPRQERSIQRLQAIMDAAESLILEKGVADVTMSEIAQRAAIPIGSVYQFFPQKAAVVKALHDRLAGRLDTVFRQIFAGAETLDHAAERAADCLLDLYTRFRREPIYISLWQVVATDNSLARMVGDFHDHLIQTFYRDLSHLVPEPDFARFKIHMKLMIVSTAEVIRFACRETDDVARAHLEHWRRFLRTNIFAY
jgi:AcrR family transcriptional regulator